jgi:DNA repair protein RecN (Recombination protein N)
MLRELELSHFILIDKLSLSFSAGMSVFTGETGAGKSIILDALLLILGGRLSQNVVREGQEKADLSAIFDATPALINYLVSQEIDCETEVILRRVVTREGRSKHFINGQVVSQQQVKSLWPYLLHIHGQHEHQSLLKSEEQREIVDRYAAHDDLLEAVKKGFETYQIATHALKDFEALITDPSTDLVFLQKEYEALLSLHLTEGEFERLAERYRQLSQGAEFEKKLEEAVQLLGQTPKNAAVFLSLAKKSLLGTLKVDEGMQAFIDKVESLRLETMELSEALQDKLLKLQADASSIDDIELRLNKAHELARKHRVMPELLFTLEQKFFEQITRLNNQESEKITLEKALAEALKYYKKAADSLSASRKEACDRLSIEMNGLLQTLNMKGSALSVHLTSLSIPSLYGQEAVSFLIKTNEGQAFYPLAEIASGGELSRISLALQLCIARDKETPCLIFDEVDVGIGGATAEVVGKMLRRLGQKTQVICITHLAQVAAEGDHHYRVHKQTHSGQTYTTIEPLDKKARIEEIARMIGGVSLTEHSFAHAKAMLEGRG